MPDFRNPAFLSNPLFSLGIGILAQDPRNSTGQNIGQGLITGAQLFQQFRANSIREQAAQYEAQRRLEEENRRKAQEQARSEYFQNSPPDVRQLSQFDTGAALELQKSNQTQAKELDALKDAQVNLLSRVQGRPLDQHQRALVFNALQAQDFNSFDKYIGDYAKTFDLPSSVDEAMFISGGNEAEAREFLKGRRQRPGVEVNVNTGTKDLDDKTVRTIQESIKSTDDALDVVSDARKLLRENPGLVGIVGATKGILGQTVGTVSDILGPDTGLGKAARNLQVKLDAGERKQLQQMATVLESQLLPFITNETSRFTDPERLQARKVVGLFGQATTDFEATVALESLEQMLNKAKSRNENTLLQGEMKNLSGAKFFSPKNPGRIITPAEIGKTAEETGLLPSQVIERLQLQIAK